MRKIIARFAVALSAFCLGIFAYVVAQGLQGTREPIVKARPVIELIDDERCYELTPRGMVVDAYGKSYSFGSVRYRRPGCPFLFKLADGTGRS